MGPCWLEIANVVNANEKLSWCNVEVDVDSAKSVKVLANPPTPPPLTVMSLRFQTVISPSSKQHEVSQPFESVP
jgi:hypothetical protein